MVPDRGLRVWSTFLKEGLIRRGFVQSKIDECIFYYKSSVFMVYVDDTVLVGPKAEDLEGAYQVIKAESSPGVNDGFDITDDGDLNDFLGVKLERNEDGTIKLSQPHLIEMIMTNK